MQLDQTTLKLTSSIFLFFFILLSCHQKSFQEQIDDVGTKFSKQSEIQNEEILSWEKKIDSIYSIADTNQTIAINNIDNLIQCNATLSNEKASDLHFIKGDIYYRTDSFNKAIYEFSVAAQKDHFENPKILAAKAGAHIKLRKYETALQELKQAADINYDYFWNIGNYYELRGQKDSALINYQKLYNHDTTVYKYCENRIEELKKNKPTLLSELIYKDRERKILLTDGLK